MRKLQKILSGKKAYIAAVLIILYAVLGFVLGFLESSVVGELILEAMAVAGLRAGIAKS